MFRRHSLGTLDEVMKPLAPDSASHAAPNITDSRKRTASIGASFLCWYRLNVKQSWKRVNTVSFLSSNGFLISLRRADATQSSILCAKHGARLEASN